MYSWLALLWLPPDAHFLSRHVALLKIQGKEFSLTPIPLRTVRPFVLGDVILTDAAEDEGLDLSDKMEITKYLKKRVCSPIYTPDYALMKCR